MGNLEKAIDLLWEVKENKKHPNRAFKELSVLFGVKEDSCEHAVSEQKNLRCTCCAECGEILDVLD